MSSTWVLRVTHNVSAQSMPLLLTLTRVLFYQLWILTMTKTVLSTVLTFTDVCPELMSRQLQTMVVFQCADKKKKKPPFDPVPLAHRVFGFAPKTNHVYGRWITVGGSDAEYIKKPIASVRLTPKIQSVCFQEPRIDRERERVCTTLAHKPPRAW